MKLQKGDIVKFTKRLTSQIPELPRTGVVMRQEKFEQIWVRPDGKKHASQFHKTFLRKLK